MIYFSLGTNFSSSRKEGNVNIGRALERCVQYNLFYYLRLKISRRYIGLSICILLNVALDL